MLQDALDEQRTYNMANILQKAILNQQLKAPVPGGDPGWQCGFLRLPTILWHFNRRGDLLWGCGKML